MENGNTYKWVQVCVCKQHVSNPSIFSIRREREKREKTEKRERG